MSTKTHLMKMFAVSALFVVSPIEAATLLGPTPYLAFDNSTPGAGTAISPFSSLGFSWFHLEDFEDQLLNTPGVSASAGGVTGVVFGPNNHDSVDADDGTIDGSGLGGDTWISLEAAVGVTFSFNETILGSLPTHAGLVWTDGSASAGIITFEAFDASGDSLGTLIGTHADDVTNGGTGDDRFYGVTHQGGISKISIKNTIFPPHLLGIELDHLQYGFSVIPEPSRAVLILVGLTGAGMSRRCGSVWL